MPSDLGNILPPIPIRLLTLSDFFSNLIGIAYTFIALIFLFMLLLSSWQWITSGANKETVAQARARIVNAIIGLAILGMASFIYNVIARIVRFPEQ